MKKQKKDKKIIAVMLELSIIQQLTDKSKKDGENNVSATIRRAITFYLSQNNPN